MICEATRSKMYFEPLIRSENYITNTKTFYLGKTLEQLRGDEDKLVFVTIAFNKYRDNNEVVKEEAILVPKHTDIERYLNDTYQESFLKKNYQVFDFFKDKGILTSSYFATDFEMFEEQCAEIIDTDDTEMKVHFDTTSKTHERKDKSPYYYSLEVKDNLRIDKSEENCLKDSDRVLFVVSYDGPSDTHFKDYYLIPSYTDIEDFIADKHDNDGISHVKTFTIEEGFRTKFDGNFEGSGIVYAHPNTEQLFSTFTWTEEGKGTNGYNAHYRLGHIKRSDSNLPTWQEYYVKKGMTIPLVNDDSHVIPLTSGDDTPTGNVWTNDPNTRTGDDLRFRTGDDIKNSPYTFTGVDPYDFTKKLYGDDATEARILEKIDRSLNKIVRRLDKLEKAVKIKK